MKHKSPSSLSLLTHIKDGIENVKGEDIVIIDFSKRENSICSYFVICNGNSNTQVKAISSSVERHVKNTTKEHPFRVEGFGNGEWILIDYSSIIVHVFQKDKRDFYDIENLWGDIEILDITTLNKQGIEK